MRHTPNGLRTFLSSFFTIPPPTQSALPAIAAQPVDGVIPVVYRLSMFRRFGDYHPIHIHPHAKVLAGNVGQSIAACGVATAYEAAGPI